MARIAVAAYVAFFVMAFGWRSWLQYRRTGDVGIRTPSRRSSIVEWGSWSLTALGGFAAFLAALMTLTDVIQPVVFLPAQIAGLLVLAAGFVLTVIAQLHLGASWRIGVDAREVTPLITGGVFRYVRNPIFTGVLMALLGLVLLLPHALSVLGLAMVVAGLEMHVRWVEEPYLLQTHGESYRMYARSVGRFLPKVGYFPS